MSGTLRGEERTAKQSQPQSAGEERLVRAHTPVLRLWSAAVFESLAWKTMERVVGFSRDSGCIRGPVFAADVKVCLGSPEELE